MSVLIDKQVAISMFWEFHGEDIMTDWKYLEKVRGYLNAK